MPLVPVETPASEAKMTTSEAKMTTSDGPMRMLEGLTILVSGGSGALGMAVCRVAAREGAQVAFTYHRGEERAQALASEPEQGGTRVLSAQVEATDAQAVEAFVTRVEEPAASTP